MLYCTTTASFNMTSKHKTHVVDKPLNTVSSIGNHCGVLTHQQKCRLMDASQKGKLVNMMATTNMPTNKTKQNNYLQERFSSNLLTSCRINLYNILSRHNKVCFSKKFMTDHLLEIQQIHTASLCIWKSAI